MKLNKIVIKSYRTIKNIEIILNSSSNLIVGKNNIGKSNVLKAVNLFFNNLDNYGKTAIINDEEFRHNTERIVVILHFNNIDNHLKLLEDNIKEIRDKRNVNLKHLKTIELNYHRLSRIKNKFSSIALKLEIKRNSHEQIFTFIDKVTMSREKKFKDSMIKRYLYEKYNPKEFKRFMNNESIRWNFYDKLDVTKVSENKVKINFIDGEQTVTFSEDEIKEFNKDVFKKNLLNYVNVNFKFLYIPAYRGGKMEREQILDRLFDIIIEDLISTKGVTKEYDRITDAIWGTGKNSNIYNLHSVISKRIDELVRKLTNNTINTIENVEFDSLPHKEIRRQILRIMMGKPSLFLNDGVKTSFESKGTGIQSSFMITLMKALSEFEYVNSRSILLAVEEPEAFTHPQLTREIIDLMIHKNPNESIQFLITTHSPVIVDYMSAETIIRLGERKQSKNQKETINLMNNYTDSLNHNDWSIINRFTDIEMSEIVFADFVVLVEGEGDKHVFEMLLRRVIPKYYHRLSVVSIGGNNQIFKLLNLLKYFKVNWLFITDKDSFVERSFSEENDVNLQNISDFFDKFQIGDQYKKSFNSVLSNYNVEYIKIRSSMSESIKFGPLLKKVKLLSENTDLNTDMLFELTTKKMEDDFISEIDEIKITNDLNNQLIADDVPLYLLSSDLEGFIVNDATLEFSLDILSRNFPIPFNSLLKKIENYSREQKIREIRKFIGSKLSTIIKVSNSSVRRKKPHIPIEICSEYLNKIESTSPEKLLSDFPLLELLVNRISVSFK